MSNARNLARVLVDSSGDIAAGNLDNAVPADGSITDAKIASMTASKLLGQVPDANAPSGSVVQIALGSALPGGVTTTSTSFIDTGIIEVAITPSLANSRIHAYMGGFQTHINPQADNWGGFLHIYFSVAGGAYQPINGSTTNGLWAIYANNQYTDSWRDIVAKMEFAHSPTYTLGQSIAYRAYFKKATRGASGFYSSHTGGISAYGGTVNVFGSVTEISA